MTEGPERRWPGWTADAAAPGPGPEAPAAAPAARGEEGEEPGQRGQATPAPPARLPASQTWGRHACVWARTFPSRALSGPNRNDLTRVPWGATPTVWPAGLVSSQR